MPRTTALGRAAQRDDVAFGFALFFAALAPRLFVALRWAAEPVWDGHYYDFGARRIAAGLGYSDDRFVADHLLWHPWCHYPVGYSGFLSFFYRIFGPDLRVAGVVDAVVGALCAVFAWLLARHAMSATRARVAGALVALHPGLVLYAGLVMTEPLAALTTLVAFWLAVRRRTMPAFVLGALVLGLTCLVRPQTLLVAPFFGLLPLPERLRRLGRLGRPAAAALACALTLAPMLPWTARNCEVMDGCALVSTNAGWNLAIGAFPRATGRFETLRASDGCRDVIGQVHQDRCWRAYAVDQIRRHPWHWLALVPKKLSYTFDHESFEVEYLHEARPSMWPEQRRVAWRDLTTMVHRLLVCIAALGVIGFATRGRGGAVQGALLAVTAALAAWGASESSPAFWPLVLLICVVPWLPLPGAPPRPPALTLGLGLIATTVVTHAIFFGEDRYHVVVIPILCMLAAGAFRAPAWRGRRGGQVT